MASDYPASIDAFPDPLVNSPLNSPSHAALHQDVNDAVEKVQVKLGLGVSPASGASDGEVLMADGSGGSDWSNIGAGNIKTEGAAAGSLLVSDGAGSGAFVTNDIGLVLVKTQTIGATPISSILVPDAFSANFTNYRIIVSGGTSNTPLALGMQMGTTLTGTGYYLGLTGTNYSGGASVGNLANGTLWTVAGSAMPNGMALDVTLTEPFLVRRTGVSFNSRIDYRTTGAATSGNGFHDVAASYTGFALSVAGGTFNSGIIRVYGFRD
jgi:hypothetical protein